MSDIDVLFRTMLRSLQEGMVRLESDLELLSKAEVVDHRSLQRLAELSAGFHIQAEGLLGMALDRDAELDLIDQADGLFDYFSDTAERLDRLSQMPRGRG